MKFKIALIPIIILAGGFVIMLLLFSLKSEDPARHKVIQPKIVETLDVEYGEVLTKIVAYGRLTSSQPVTLFSEVSGKLKPGNIPFQPAQSFKKGDLLIKVDDRQLIFDINSVKSDFLTALASVLPEIKVDFPDDFEKWQDYFNSCGFDNNLKALPESSDPKLKMYLSRHNVYKLFFSVRNLEIRLEKHFFYAPFNGSITSADLRVGSTARIGTKLGEIINLENLEVEIPLRADEIQWIDKNKPVLFTSSEIRGSWKGNIKRIGKNIEDRTQTVQVFVGIEKDKSGNLFDGTFFKAEIQGKVITNAFVIPRKALYNGKYVYIIEDEKLNYKEIEIAREETDSVIITNGLNNGDKLVTEILQGVSHGMPAKSKSIPKKPGKGRSE